MKTLSNIIPRVAAIHDLSGFGRCSLTVIMPVLSSMGVQVCPFPTAILSTHPGGFGKFLFHDFTGGMEEYARHWSCIGIEFDCIYSGFLASSKQIDIVAGFFEDFKTGGKQLFVVDPVMADHGKLYKTYTPEMQTKMRLLVEKADVITPNFTEACFLLEEPYSDEAVNASEVKHILKGLSQIGPETVVITGVKMLDGGFANVAYSRSDNVFWKVNYNFIPAQYPGTGDIFTSVFTGGLLMGDNLPIAMDRATQFVSQAVRMTYGYRTPEREGVMLEKVLGWLRNELTNCTYEIIT